MGAEVFYGSANIAVYRNDSYMLKKNNNDIIQPIPPTPIWTRLEAGKLWTKKGATTHVFLFMLVNEKGQNKC